MRPDKTSIIIMGSLLGHYAVVERKYIKGQKHPLYTILADYPTLAAAQYAKSLMR